MNMFLGLSGKVSIMRVLTALIIVVVLGTWVAGNVICWHSQCSFINIGIQEVALILGSLAAKTAQRVAEGKANGNGNGKSIA